MKATGIVRRIDDLGRVVIPKEIRRTLHIREGDPLEIFTDRDGGVIFKKYSPLGEMSSYAKDCCAALYSVTGIYCAVCDMDSIVALAGQGKRELLEKSISNECADIAESRKPYFSGGVGKGVAITDDIGAPLISAAAPIISEGDISGIVAFLDTPSKVPGDTEKKLLAVSALFLSKQLEN